MFRLVFLSLLVQLLKAEIERSNLRGLLESVQHPCANDIKSICHTDMPFSFETVFAARMCLWSSEEKLSSECRRFLTVEKPSIVEPCLQQIRTFCPDVEPGMSRIHSCLYSNVEDLTVRCAGALQNEFVGAEEVNEDDFISKTFPESKVDSRSDEMSTFGLQSLLNWVQNSLSKTNGDGFMSLSEASSMSTVDMPTSEDMASEQIHLMRPLTNLNDVEDRSAYAKRLGDDDRAVMESSMFRPLQYPDVSSASPASGASSVKDGSTSSSSSSSWVTLTVRSPNANSATSWISSFMSMIGVNVAQEHKSSANMSLEPQRAQDQEQVESTMSLLDISALVPQESPEEELTGLLDGINSDMNKEVISNVPTAATTTSSLRMRQTTVEIPRRLLDFIN